jgi:hypothetical protein
MGEDKRAASGMSIDFEVAEYRSTSESFSSPY